MLLVARWDNLALPAAGSYFREEGPRRDRLTSSQPESANAGLVEPEVVTDLVPDRGDDLLSEALDQAWWATSHSCPGQLHLVPTGLAGVNDKPLPSRHIWPAKSL